MNRKNPDDLSFQITVGQLTLPSPLAKQDIRVTVCVGDESKITCCGEFSDDGLTIAWNHPFLFTAAPSMTVGVAICILPEELTSEWDKQPLGNQIVTNVASLLESGNIYNVSGLSAGPATFSVTCRASDILNVPAGHDCLSSLTQYMSKLYEFAWGFKNVACVFTAVEVNLSRLDLCPISHAEYTTILKDLAVAFAFCYDQEGNILNLNRAIEIEQIRLKLCPLGHPEHIDALGELALSLSRHYKLQENKEDLHKLIEIQQRWLDLCPLGHPKHTGALGLVAVSLLDRYYVWKDITDLDRAIKMGEKLLDLCPSGHLDHDIALNDLAQAIQTRYEILGNLTDLSRATGLQEKYLELCPPGHKYHGIALWNLVESLRVQYIKRGSNTDLEKAITLLKEALNTYPVQHCFFPSIAARLAEIILLLLKSSTSFHHPDQPPPSLDEAFEIYKLLKRCGPSASLDLWNATQTWVQDAEKHNHPSVLEAYETSLNTLDRFTSLNSSLDSRHETMQARVTDLANNAFSCATRHGNLQMAVEFLEQGRGMLWNQLARFDISIGLLKSQDDRGRERLHRKFTRLSADLRKHAQRSTGQDTDPYWRIQKEWQSVVDEIRRLDGFCRFLLPPRFDDLQQAAEFGPVIIVNASKYGCDALIVLHTRAPVHVPLRCSLDDVVQICSQLSKLTQDTHAYGPNRELYVKEVLRDLWSSVVEPIATTLQNDARLPRGSRIWWCPTSKFTILPFHAAGPHRGGMKNLMDIYVSSFAPSLSALLRARDRLRSHREAHGTSEPTNHILFAAVGQANPSTDAKLGALPEVDHEIQRIRNETNMPSSVKFETITGPEASIEGAVQAFRDHRWVHVACHGAQHPKKPFDSWFAMGDGKLTLMRIIQERYTYSEFAFLSACHTAVGDATTPDEVLHLAAGMQFAGFSGVIGTLWRVDDAVAHQVVTRFYQNMFKYPVIDSENAASALNTAALETADEVSLEKRIVFVHIGI